MTSIRKAAALIGKSPGTLHRWKTTNPHLYRAVIEYAKRQERLSAKSIDKPGTID